MEVLLAEAILNIEPLRVNGKSLLKLQTHLLNP